MRTEKQIREWLDNQPWKEEFLEELLLATGERDEWKLDQYFINSAFNWKKTRSGPEVWQRRQEEFLKWFDTGLKIESYEEYCKNNPIKENDYLINTLENKITPMNISSKRHVEDYSIMPKELCEAFVAYMKLIQLRNSWECGSYCPYKIIVIDNNISIRSSAFDSYKGLSFSNFEVAKYFIKVFDDLLETAKPLL